MSSTIKRKSTRLRLGYGGQASKIRRKGKTERKRKK
jgi:hypothetical protein